jgi:hypothetical protein
MSDEKSPEVEEQSIKLILTSLCQHLGDICEQLAEMNQHLELFTECISISTIDGRYRIRVLSKRSD